MARQPARIALGILGLIVLLAPAASTAQEPEGLARRALADSDLAWIPRTAPELRVQFREGSYAASHQDSLLARLVAARALDLRLLGATRDPRPIWVFFVENRDEMDTLISVSVNGFSEHESGAVFLVTNPSWRAFARHEIMHVLAWRLWGRPADPADWIEEGLAQFADGACGGHPIDAVTAGIAEEEGFFQLDSLTGRFRQLDDLGAYLQATSFVGYLYREYGREAVRDVWIHGLGAASRRIGRTPTELQGEWERQLPGPARRPELSEIERVRAKGCG